MVTSLEFIEVEPTDLDDIFCQIGFVRNATFAYEQPSNCAERLATVTSRKGSASPGFED